jgi:RimJ/RimL family protein N-acetyltransferase
MIHFNNEDHGRQIMSSINSTFTPVTMQVISRSEGGVLLGGVVYENYTGPGGSILAHISGFAPNWINRDILFVMFDYPFRQLDCKQAFGQVAAKNTHSIEFNTKLGWETVITLEGVFPDDDMVLMRYRREACRFLSIKPRTLKANR